MRSPGRLAIALSMALAPVAPSSGAQARAEEGAVYEVGPGLKYERLGDVPWYRLGPGDTVRIHHRSTPYREKILISGRGTAARWIRVLGVPGPNGELPVISGDGATTSTNMHYRWQDVAGPNAIQWLGVVQIAIHEGGPLPGYIEIANLQIQDGYSAYRFKGESGAEAAYGYSAACIYARSVQHLVVRDSVLKNCGQGFYDWTGDGSSDAFWVGLAVDIVLRGNRFEGNGHAGSYTEHQVYTESDGVLVEGNVFGPMRAGALGSQLKDRSAGTVIRYNRVEQAPEGWNLDLVEPQEGWPSLGARPSYKQAFVYGNVFVNRTARASNFVHWNEDHQSGRGRAALEGGRLFFYANTLVVVANRSDIQALSVFNVTWGGYDCPPSAPAGVIDVRNNVFALLPRTRGAPVPQLRFGYCGTEGFQLGKNWVSCGWTLKGRALGGTDGLVSPSSNDPGFAGADRDDFRLAPGSTARGIGGPLAPEVTANALGLDLTPALQVSRERRTEARAVTGEGSDAGAFGR